MTALKTSSLILGLFLIMATVSAGTVARSHEATSSHIKNAEVQVQDFEAVPMPDFDLTEETYHSAVEKTAYIQEPATRKMGVLLLIFSVGAIMLFPVLLELNNATSAMRARNIQNS